MDISHEIDQPQTIPRELSVRRPRLALTLAEREQAEQCRRDAASHE